MGYPHTLRIVEGHFGGVWGLEVLGVGYVRIGFVVLVLSGGLDGYSG
jgi:hypothetical protein